MRQCRGTVKKCAGCSLAVAVWPDFPVTRPIRGAVGGKTMEISAFLDRKPARRFRTYDTDGDGFIEREDFVAAAARPGE